MKNFNHKYGTTRFLQPTLLCWMFVSSLVSLFAQQSASAANAVVPQLVNFSGVLTDLSGKPLTGVVGVTFLLYKDEQGGAPLWLETQNVQPDKSGHYKVTLGSTTSNGLPSDLFVAGEARWLGVQPQGQPEQPRIILLSVPYALKAGDAATLGGLPPSAFLLAGPAPASAAASPGVVASSSPVSVSAVTGSGTVNFLPLWTSTSNIGDSALFQSGNGSTAKVGINTTTPVGTLDVKGSSIFRGVLSLPVTGTATATKGANSQPFELAASVFNSGTSTPVTQTFQWLAEPVGNDTANATGTLNLLFAQGTAKPAETGLHIGSNGQITFASGQTFPGAITGVTAGAGLSAGGSSGNVSVSVLTGGITNTMLQNSSLTVSPGGGMTGGGKISLGNSATLGLQNCASNQILQFVGSAWACANPAVGSVTSVASGAGLSGGTITTSGTLSIAAGGVTNAMLASPSLTVAPGTGLTGGGAVALGGTTTLSVDTTKIALLGGNNIFSGSQAFGGVVGIGTTTPGAELDTFASSSGIHAPMAQFGSLGSNSTDANSILVYNGGSGSGNTYTEMFIAAPNTFIPGSLGGDGGLRVAPGANLLLGDDTFSRLTLDGLGDATIAGNANVGGSIAANGSLSVTAISVSGYLGSSEGIWAQGGTSGVDGIQGGEFHGGEGGCTSCGGTGGVGLMAFGGGGQTGGIGLYGAGGYPNGLAGYFIGNVQITGSLSSGVKDFKIDHPLDPANKYLVHASVESSEMKNIYDGTAVIDAKGEATVELPDWFAALNRDFRYQLTSVGAPSPNLYIAEEIVENHFKIAGGQPGAKVCWQVTGVRQDAFAKAHPLIVEEEKMGVEHGRYLHPELYGASEQDGISQALAPHSMIRPDAERNLTQKPSSLTSRFSPVPPPVIRRGRTVVPTKTK
jgi:hypothetical protein